MDWLRVWPDHHPPEPSPGPKRSNPDVLEPFHDDALNITYFYCLVPRFSRLACRPCLACTESSVNNTPQERLFPTVVAATPM
jgi:hypothetical protein